MARAIERIETDIKNLEAEVGAIAQDLHANYTRYFTALGMAVRQQLILATYHLCTQGYPQAFLLLSLNQRQKLQQSIRQVGNNTASKLLEYAKTDRDGDTNTDNSDNEDSETLGSDSSILESLSAAIVEAIGSGNQSLGSDDVNSDGDFERSDFPTFKITSVSDLSDIQNLDLDEENDDSDDDDDDDDSQEIKDKESLERLRQKLRQSRKIIIPRHLLKALPFPCESSNPSDLLKWQQSIEFATQQTIKKTSYEANLLLQKANILSAKIPEAVLNVANSASDATTEMVSRTPNLLNLVIEVDGDRGNEDSQIAPVVLINLRLGEIEFADPTVSHERKNLRNKTMQLQKLKRDYQQKVRELSIAEAEAAWRASWYEDS